MDHECEGNGNISIGFMKAYGLSGGITPLILTSALDEGDIYTTLLVM
jgi:hypothetical protein